MTPAEENQARREASIRRVHRIDALAPGQLVNFIHRLAAIVPGYVDRVLDEFDANAPKPRAEKLLHPVRVYGSESASSPSIRLYCDVCPGWHAVLEDGHLLDDFDARVREHSGILP